MSKKKKRKKIKEVKEEIWTKDQVLEALNEKKDDVESKTQVEKYFDVKLRKVYKPDAVEYGVKFDKLQGKQYQDGFYYKDGVYHIVISNSTNSKNDHYTRALKVDGKRFYEVVYLLLTVLHRNKDNKYVVYYELGTSKSMKKDMKKKAEEVLNIID